MLLKYIIKYLLHSKILRRKSIVLTFLENLIATNVFIWEKCLNKINMFFILSMTGNF